MIEPDCQNEFYLADAANGTRASDFQKMLSLLPDVVCFNGRPNQYMKDPIRVKVGDRVRFWVVSAGPSHPCHFHVVGDVIHGRFTPNALLL